MSDSLPTPNGISLADLPPDIIRMIIPMVEEPRDREMELLSRTWSSVALDYLKRRYRPIYGIGIVANMLSITLRYEDLNHFGLEEWEKENNVNTRKIEVYPQLTSQKASEDIIRDTLMKLNGLCSHVQMMELTDVDTDILNIVRSCLGPVRISSITVVETIDCNMVKFAESSFKIICKEMAKKHHTEVVTFNGNRVYAKQ